MKPLWLRRSFGWQTSLQAWRASRLCAWLFAGGCFDDGLGGIQRVCRGRSTGVGSVGAETHGKIVNVRFEFGDASLQRDDAFVALLTTGTMQLDHEDILGIRQGKGDVCQLGERLRCANNGDYYNALKAYQAIKAVRPGDRITTFEILGLYSTLCLKDEAIRLLTSWLTIAPEDFDAHACLAKLYIEKMEMAKAREHLDRASKIDLDSPIISFLTATLYRSNGRLDESTDLIQSTLELQCNPGQVELVVNGMLTLARNYIDQNRRADAVGVLDHVREPVQAPLRRHAFTQFLKVLRVKVDCQSLFPECGYNFVGGGSILRPGVRG
jgi:tetratricopeptide (TPR) repeat protein